MIIQRIGVYYKLFFREVGLFLCGDLVEVASGDIARCRESHVVCHVSRKGGATIDLARRIDELDELGEDDFTSALKARDVQRNRALVTLEKGGWNAAFLGGVL